MSNHEVTSRPIVKVDGPRVYSYLGARAEVTTTHHDKSRFGLRTVRMHWIDQATPENGGWAAGTTTERVIKGNFFTGPSFEIIEAIRAI
jgi:hypothetical protein